MKLFQIILGKKDSFLKYLNYSNDAFQKMNPNLECIKIIYDFKNIHDVYVKRKIQNEYDELLLEALNNYNNTLLSYSTKKFNDDRENFYYCHLRRNVMCSISNHFRWSILNRFKKSLYLDIDTFPIKPFDDYFFENYNIGQCENRDQVDNWFLYGNNKISKIYKNPIFQNHYTIQDRQNIKKDFLEMKLKSPYKEEDKDYYFYHFYSQFKFY